MTVYYAHSIHLYNTPQEQRDVYLLEDLGFTVYNPNNEELQKEVEEYKRNTELAKTSSIMDLFKRYIDSCDALAYRSHVDLKIPSGVWFEIQYAKEQNKLIFELPTITPSRELTYKETIEYLKYNGQR